MKVEATWRGPGRLELLIHGVQPGEAEALLDSLGASTEPEVIANIEATGWAMGFTGGTFFGPVWHWFSRGWSACHRWRSDRATGPFLPVLVDGGRECSGCEAAA